MRCSFGAATRTHSLVDWVKATKPNIISGFFCLDLLDLTKLNPTYIFFCNRWSKITEN
ncbi:MAG: hypothetical protein F6K56_20120 [Moorea sp. SIO3G5]|nr:hypothetical protein [Moorena sp. SIO3G5]